MEALAALGVILALVVVVTPFIAFGLVLGARKRIAALEREMEDRERELRYLYEELKAEKSAREERRAPASPANAPVASPPLDSPPASAQTQTTGVVNPEAAGVRGRPPTSDAAHGATHEAGAGAAQAHGATHETGAGEPKAPQQDSVPPTERPPISLEQRFAAWFTRIGAGALLLGILYAYKYAVDNEWIGPSFRVLIGAIAGMGILVFAEIARRKTHRAFIHVLLGVGLACLYVSAYASSAFYRLVDVSTAFLASTIILGLGVVLARRYRAEAVLILVLAAGFLNPVLLSTGEDRPFALFSYLFVLTTASLAVSVTMRFRIAIPLAVLGVAAIFSGWYLEYFRVFDHRGEPWAGDRPPEDLVGAYHALAARIVPLAFVGLFTLQWLGTALWLKRSGAFPRALKAIAIAALLLSHVGASALLHDRPIHLGGAMIVLGALAVGSLRHLDATRFLLVPMLAAFMMLAALTSGTRETEQIAVLGLLGAWTAVYVTAFLRDLSGRNRAIERGDAIRTGIALSAFGVLAAILLLPSERTYACGLAMTGTSAAIAVVAERARLPQMTLAALALSFVPWMIAAPMTRPDENHVDFAFLGISLLWAGTYAFAILRGALRSERSTKEASWVSLLTLSLAGLMFVATAIASTSEEVPTLRALVTGGAGTADLLFALAIRSNKNRAILPWVTILAAQALGLFAPALAFAFSGATITVLWALLSVVSMLILRESRDPPWLALTSLLVVVTITRIVWFDVASVEGEIERFALTGGRSGVLAVPALFNPRGYALLGSGAAFLAGAFALSRAARQASPKSQIGSRAFLVLAPLIATIAYVLLTALAIVETRVYLLDLPPAPPVLLDEEEFSMFMSSILDAERAQENLLAMSTTLVLAAVAMVLLAIGFAAKDIFHRYLGLIVFLGTIGKLVLWDVWNLPRVYQVVVLTVVGALLLASGFLYARLKALFRGPSAAAMVALFLLVPPAFQAEAGDHEHSTPAVKAHFYRWHGAITGATQPGDYRLRVGFELYRKSSSPAPLDDIRIADPAGREVPYVLREIEAEKPATNVEARIFDPGEVGDGAYRATFELPPEMEHCTAVLDLERSEPFLRRTRVETGTKLSDLQLVSEGAIVYSVSIAENRAESFTIRYPPSIARFARITLLPDADAPVTRILAARFSCAAPAMIAPTARLPLAILERRRDAEQRTTEIELDSGGEGVPIERLHLKVETPEFVRRIEVLASSHRSVWPSVGSGVIYRVGKSEGPESTSIPISTVRKRWLKIRIFDNDDAPIAVTHAEASLREREIIFRTSRPGQPVLYVGDERGTDATASYDLASIIARRPDALETKTAFVGALEDNPRFGVPEHAPSLPVTEHHRGKIGIALAAILLGLALWAVKLIRTPRD